MRVTMTTTVATLLLVVGSWAWQAPLKSIPRHIRHRRYTVEPPSTTTSSAVEEEQNVEVVSEEVPDELTEKQKEIARLKAAEKFIQEETGVYICKVCSYKYEPEKGQPIAQIAPGTPFSELPAAWRCPTCRAGKDAFAPVTLEIAGFAENQSYGLGGNSMTSESKNGLIFGGLAVFFALFMGGYLLN